MVDRWIRSFVSNSTNPSTTSSTPIKFLIPKVTLPSFLPHAHYIDYRTALILISLPSQIYISIVDTKLHHRSSSSFVPRHLAWVQKTGAPFSIIKKAERCLMCLLIRLQGTPAVHLSRLPHHEGQKRIALWSHFFWEMQRRNSKNLQGRSVNKESLQIDHLQTLFRRSWLPTLSFIKKRNTKRCKRSQSLD